MTMNLVRERDFSSKTGGPVLRLPTWNTLTRLRKYRSQCWLSRLSDLCPNSLRVLACAYLSITTFLGQITVTILTVAPYIAFSCKDEMTHNLLQCWWSTNMIYMKGNDFADHEENEDFLCVSSKNVSRPKWPTVYRYEKWQPSIVNPVYKQNVINAYYPLTMWPSIFWEILSLIWVAIQNVHKRKNLNCASIINSRKGRPSKVKNDDVP